MTSPAARVQRTYLLLTLLTTLAASFIWGINTLFLLDAGLNNTEAFPANAFFALGQVIFEVPTGVVADTRGRRFSFLLGAATLLLSTLLYLGMWQGLVVAWGFMRDLGFTPQRAPSPIKAVRTVLRGSIDAGFRNPPVRWLMLAGPFGAGGGFYLFFAVQPPPPRPLRGRAGP